LGEKKIDLRPSLVSVSTANGQRRTKGGGIKGIYTPKCQNWT